jgi:hypothetical protein
MVKMARWLGFLTHLAAERRLDPALKALETVDGDGSLSDG